RADALERREGGDVDRHPATVLVVEDAAAAPDQLLELLRHRLPDARDAGERLHTAGAVELLERPIVRLDRLRRLLVRARLEGDVVHLEIRGDVPEAARQLGVPHPADA